MNLNRFVNIGEAVRVWGTISRPDTGQTLQLEPRETADLDLPKDFTDPYLEYVGPAYRRTSKPRLDTKLEESQDSTDQGTEPSEEARAEEVSDPASTDAGA